MMKYILLLIPVIITAFWAIRLRLASNKGSAAKKTLSTFMLFAFIVYLAHFLYFAPFHCLYTIIDPFYQLAMLLVYPVFYIYIRLLTKDASFTAKKHIRFLIAPVMLFLLYCIATLFTPAAEFSDWIFNRNITMPETTFIRALHIGIRICFLVEVILTINANVQLIRHYGVRAEEFYSSPNDSSTWKAKILIAMMILTGVSSLILGAIGREIFSHNLPFMATASAVFSTSLFLIGYLGNKQKVINPDYEQGQSKPLGAGGKQVPPQLEQEIIARITQLFEKENLYKYSELTIIDLAQAIGTNRTYLSQVINQHFNVTFSVFVNNYRLKHTEQLIKEDPGQNYQLLAAESGFGSIDSLKRAVKARHGVSFAEWKKQLVSQVHHKRTEK